ncbi:MAG: transporter substrate-binding domain-containing protein [Alphaproteobacteria bacterium]|nr:transporter substrate-binding domain-containing protein [Alphaproteobacteria bacterium]
MLRFMARLAVALALLAGFGTPARADVFADILSRGTVRIAVFQDVPPFGSPNAKRELEGFDIDMANMVAKAMGVKLELVPVTAANRIPYLLTNMVDINIALMSITPERAKQIMFSAPYVNTSLAVYGPKNLKVTSAAELGSNKVAAAKGTTEEVELTTLNPQASILRMEDNAAAVQAYLSGQSQLWAGNSLIVIELAKKNPTVEFDRKFVIRRAPGHMAVKMGEHALLRWLDSFVFFNTMNGELDKLHRKWLGIAMDPLPSL